MTSPQPYPITDLFAWVIDDPSGTMGIIGVMPLPDGNTLQAVTSKRHVIELPHMRDLAQSIARQTGYTVRLQRFTLAETMRTVTP